MNTRTKRRIVERKIVEKLREGIGANRICRELKVGKRRVQDTRQLKLYRLAATTVGAGSTTVDLFTVSDPAVQVFIALHFLMSEWRVCYVAEHTEPKFRLAPYPLN